MKIVIIGAGVAGLGVGWRLAQAGAEVTILERSRPGGGATWAAAGMIAVTAELLDAHAAEIEFARQSNALWPEFAEEVEAASDRAVGFARKGAMILAADAPELARLTRKASDPGLSMLDPGQVRALAPLVTGPQAGALWSPKEAVVDNRALGTALAVAFQRAGGRLNANEAVVRIERKGGRAAIAHTPFGLYHADVFVLAAGAWSGMIEAELAPITPVKGEMIALEPPPDIRGGGAALPEQVIWGHGVYVVPRDGRLFVGATAEMVGFDTAITEEAARALRAGAENLLPAVKDWALVDQWAGLRPRAPDGLPLLGPTSVDGLWLASGQFRNGILFAPAIAQSIAAQLMGKAAPIAAFDPRRLKP
jgi:glycine oxidase